MKIKPLTKSQVILIISILLCALSVYSLMKDIFVEKERQQARQRLQETLKQMDALGVKVQQKTKEISQVNAELKECSLKVKNLGLNRLDAECDRSFTKSQLLINEWVTYKQQHDQVMTLFRKDYCFLYADSAQSDCQKQFESKSK
jgi:septal ring factor EnvC (AmiA/AmiB activator)